MFGKHSTTRSRLDGATVLVAGILTAILVLTPGHRGRDGPLPVEAELADLTLAATSSWASSPPPAAVPTGAAEQSDTPTLPVGVSSDWWAAVSSRIAASEYEVSASEGVLQAPNRAQNLRTRFRESGIEVRPRDLRVADWRLTWNLAAWGREDRLEAVTATGPLFDARRVEYRRPGLVEWYENAEQGLEQGFTVDAAPAGEGRLCFEGAIGGDLQAALRDDGGTIEFLDERGARVIRYSKLVAWDASGRELPGQMALADGALRLCIDDTGAEYPVTVDPLLDTPDWYFDGEAGGSSFGYSVATAGDVNGDGYSDVIVGAPLYNNTGRAFVFHGSASGLESDWDGVVMTTCSTAMLGFSVASAGDVNGDGYDDVIIGAPQYTDGAPDWMEGRAYVFHGGPSGIHGGVLDWDVLGGQANAYLGHSVASAGDVNGDGYADVVIGAVNATHGQNMEGLAYVYLGSAAGLEADWDWRGEGNQEFSDYGFCVSSAGDVDADGYDDIIVGSPGYLHDDEYGRAFVYAGSADGVSDAAIWDVGISTNLRFGHSVATAGDVNGDGYSDVLVGSPGVSGDETYEGHAYLYEGSASGPSLTADWEDDGGQEGCEYGQWVATAGDINADGYADVLVSAPLHDHGEEDEGIVYCYRGHYDGLSADPCWSIEGDLVGVHHG
ncbi:MAG: FG-GAP repeat protein [Kiritimatiellae bacterium]|nr:FG-GAP repeat protein [Kiritimatiellia bacterium]